MDVCPLPPWMCVPYHLSTSAEHSEPSGDGCIGVAMQGTVNDDTINEGAVIEGVACEGVTSEGTLGEGVVHDMMDDEVYSGDETEQLSLFDELTQMSLDERKSFSSHQICHTATVCWSSSGHCGSLIY